MSPEANPAWRGDWAARVHEALSRRGFASLADLLQAFPVDTYPQIAERLGSDVAPVQIHQLQFLEAKKSKSVRSAAIDGLVRHLRDHLPRGWSGDSASRSKAMDAFAHWAGMVETRGEIEVADVLLAVWRALERVSPPEGWLPSGTVDEILIKAFAEAWPAR